MSVIVLGAALAGCNTKERAQLRSQNDSLRVALNESKQVEATLGEVGVLLDSIDADRKALNTNMVEGTKYSDYTARLNNINGYLKQSRARIDELEKSLKNTNSAYTATIRRLKADLEARSTQIASLEKEVETMRTENTSLAQSVSRRDSTIAVNTEMIRLKESDIAGLETKMEENAAAAKAAQADLYYAEAQALETAATRTKFAPKKKKETRKQALELYKISVSLGKSEAQGKVDELEKSI